jgi:alpha-tubulin suppressor-like RCC1 family protein
VCIAGSCTSALEVGLGLGFGCARFADGHVGCFGLNSSGQLGRGLPATASSYPMAFLTLTNVAKIALHRNHACAIGSNGALHCWGNNSSLQIPNAEAVDQPSPVPTRTGVAEVAVGATHTCVMLTEGGTIECAGGNAYGQRGDGTNMVATPWSGPSSLSGVDKLVSGSNHVCALKGGQVYCWGANLDGQCGIGTSTVAVTAPTLVSGLTGVDDISAGDAHTCAVVDGAVYCWGRNTSYELGSGPSTVDQLFPSHISGITTAASVAAGYYHTCIALQNDTVQCWGSASYGQNGGTATNYTRNTPPGTFDMVVAGSDHSCGLDDEDIFCWGSSTSTSAANIANNHTPQRIPR